MRPGVEGHRYIPVCRRSRHYKCIPPDFQNDMVSMSHYRSVLSGKKHPRLDTGSPVRIHHRYPQRTVKVLSFSIGLPPLGRRPCQARSYIPIGHWSLHREYSQRLRRWRSSRCRRCWPSHRRLSRWLLKRRSFQRQRKSFLFWCSSHRWHRRWRSGKSQ